MAWSSSKVAILLTVVRATASQEGSVAEPVCRRGACDGEPGAAALGLLQTDSAARRSRVAAGPAAGRRSGSRSTTDLVLQHVPYNFGHTVEKVAGFGNGKDAYRRYTIATAGVMSASLPKEAKWAVVEQEGRANGDFWGNLNPDLVQISNVTGCPLYYTPGKYWPKDVAEHYFGNKTIFGMLRDPYERLVAMFRGNFDNYGGSYPEYFRRCDVDGAVRLMMTNYLAGDRYAEGCTFVPQAEYFDAPFGIELAVDNRLFPSSLNEVFAKHGYDLQIQPEDVLHVTSCPEVWSGDLSCETKALVKKVYQRDFELLCTHFGRCDVDENDCIAEVPTMCPTSLEEKRKTATYCKRQ